jgi:hypothetical protein
MRVWPLLLISLLLTPCMSRAGTIFIDFQLSGSTVHALGGQLVVPPDGGVTGGTLTLAIPGTDIATPLAGAAEVAGLALTADFAKTLFGVTLSGTFAFTQQGAAAATLGSGLASLDLPLLVANVMVHVECSGASCALLGTFPVDESDTGSFANTQLTLEDLIQPGMASVFGSIESAPGQPLVELSGKETGRHFVVPEPATGTLALAGLAGLASRARPRRPRAAR